MRFLPLALVAVLVPGMAIVAVMIGARGRHAAIAPAPLLPAPEPPRVSEAESMGRPSPTPLPTHATSAVSRDRRQSIREAQERIARSLTQELSLEEAEASRFMIDYMEFADRVIDLDVSARGIDASTELLRRCRSDLESRTAAYLSTSQQERLRQLLATR
jgi:hypothetical protein